MNQAHLQVPRSARYFTVGGEAEVVNEIWYACHGYRQLANRFLSRFLGISAPDRLIVAPEGLSRFYLEGDGREHRSTDRVGATWMTAEDRETEISDYVRYLDILAAHIETKRDGRGVLSRTLLGFSQGVHTVCRWAALGTTSPDHLILWAAYPPEDLPEGAIERLNSCRISLVRGRSDPYITDDQHAAQLLRMREAGFRFEEVEHEGPHELDGETLTALAGG